MDLNIGGFVRDSVVDGPGIRHVLFLQGCSKNPKCSNCHNKHLWIPEEGQMTSFEYLFDLLEEYISGTVGLTLSGGEPLDQYQMLCKFLDKINHKRYSCNRFNGKFKPDILLYTYRYIDEVRQKFPKIFQYIRYVIDGPFEMDKPPALWAGSNNQKLWQREHGDWYLTSM